MKKGTFKGLLFREFYMDGKSYFYRSLSFLIVTLVCLLGLLSFQYGNLGKYEHLMPPEIKPLIEVMLRYYPFLCSFAMVPCMPITADKPVWKHFRRACPVPPFRLALAKYCHLMICLLIGGGISFAWLGLYNLLTGKPITLTDWLILIGYIVLTLIMDIIVQVSELFFKSTEYFVLFFFMFGMIVLFALFIKYPLAADTFYRFEWVKPLMDKANTYIPNMLLTSVVALLISFGCTTIRLGRREK